MICLGRRRAEEPLAVQALLDAAHIAGLNILRVMNEHTARTWYKQMQKTCKMQKLHFLHRLGVYFEATALAYGIYRSNDFDPEKPMTVAFFSCT